MTLSFIIRFHLLGNLFNHRRIDSPAHPDFFRTDGLSDEHVHAVQGLGAVATGGLQNLRVFRVIDDIDDSRKGGDDTFRCRAAVDVREHADWRAVDQDVAALRIFKVLIIDGIGTDGLREGVEFCLRVRMAGYDGNRLGSAVGQILDDGPGTAAGTEDDAVLLWMPIPACSRERPKPL